MWRRAVVSEAAGKEPGEILSDRTWGLGRGQVPAPGEDPQVAVEDRVGVLLSASRRHDAVVLAGSEQERHRDPG
jgi:hypothetical protein